MLPISLLAKLSPNATKIYLVLLAHLDSKNDLPIVQLSMESLSSLSTLAPRTCNRALDELYKLNLLQRLPHAFHEVRSYLFMPFAQTDQPPQAGHPQSSRPPEADHTPYRPPEAAHNAPLPPKNPVPNPQNAYRPLEATLLTESLPPPARPPQAAHNSRITPELLRALAEFSPERQLELLTAADQLQTLLQTST